MAITQAICTTFKNELMSGDHNLGSDTLKIAIYTSSATLSAATTTYSVTNEVTGTNYTAGGATIANNSVTTDGTTAYLDMDDTVFTNLTVSGMNGAVIYNSSQSDKAICVIAFGGDISVTASDFTISWPAPGSSTAFLRLS